MYKIRWVSPAFLRHHPPFKTATFSPAILLYKQAAKYSNQHVLE